MTLKNLNRKYIVQLIFSFIPFLISVIISLAEILPIYLIDYKLPTIFILLIVPPLYSYILLLKNHIEDLEEKNKLFINSSINQNVNAVQNQSLLRPSEIHHKLSSLSKKEKQLLKQFVDEDTRTLKLLMDDEIADGLRSLGILEFVSTIVVLGEVSYSISPIYCEYIKKRPDTIGW
jgi:hypothetical protein